MAFAVWYVTCSAADTFAGGVVGGWSQNFSFYYIPTIEDSECGLYFWHVFSPIGSFERGYVYLFQIHFVLIFCGVFSFFFFFFFVALKGLTLVDTRCLNVGVDSFGLSQ